MQGGLRLRDVSPNEQRGGLGAVYEVGGLPEGVFAQIAKVGARWRIGLATGLDVSSAAGEKFDSPTEALLALHVCLLASRRS